MSIELIERFYTAFDRRDGATMAACYAPDARFSDPVFGRLDAEQTGAMWQMLTARAEDLTVELAERDADGDRGTAHWIAHYTFTQTGRPVVNDVRATFRFQDGLILEHADKFNWWRGARLALGTPGVWLGWTPQLRLRVHRQARAGLDRWMQERDAAAPPAP